MLSYPGWNAFSPASANTAYDPLRNFLCDLLSAETPDARDNVTGSTAMTLAITLLVTLVLLPLWWNVNAPQALRRCSRWFGVLAGLATLLICIEQAFDLDLPHGAVTLTAGGLALLPTLLVVRADWRSPHTPWSRRPIIVGMLLAMIANFVSYSIVQLGGELTRVVPTAQNSALALLLAWLWLHAAPTATSRPAANKPAS